MSRPHFSLEADGEPAGPGRFVDVSAVDPLHVVRGLAMRPILGHDVLVNHVTWEPHSEAPMHVHAEEQHILVLDGEFDLTLDGETRRMRRGDYAVIPSWVPHGAVTGDSPCVEIDIFSPPRETLVEHARDQIAE
jgi:quercetin dioxygenase-like cupin family protein